MNIWFMGDVHGGHENIIKFRNQFQSEEEHFSHIEKNFNKLVTKRDKVFFMGDTAFTFEKLERIKKWNGQTKVLILGNHDTDRLNIKDLCNYFDEIHGLVKYKEFWLSHCPIHPDELRGKFNIHGHTHAFSIDDDRYFNTCPEQTYYSPISLHAIRKSLFDRGVVRKLVED